MWGYHPLIVSLANTGEVLYLVNRPGNVPSHSGAAEWIDRAVGLVAPHAERVCVRGDTDFSLTTHFDRWSREGGLHLRLRRPAGDGEAGRGAGR